MVGCPIADGIALIGARDDDNAGLSQSGSAYVFRYDADAAGKWVQEAKLTDPGGEVLDLFGQSVALCDDVAVVGAHGNDDAGLGSGAAFVFRYVPEANQGRPKWVLESQLHASDAGMSTAWFGHSVDLAEDVIVIGAPQHDGQTGAAYVLRYSSERSTWTEEAKLIAAKPVGRFPWLGYSVSITEDAQNIVAGAPLDFALGSQSGAAHVFRYENQSWNELVKLTASDGQAGDHFGGSVSPRQDNVFITAPGSGFGSVYVFAGLSGADCNDNGEPDACDIFDETSEDQNANGIPDDCDADLNGDGVVGILDLLMLLAAWGPCPAEVGCPADLDEDGVVGIIDLLLLLVNWG